MLRATAGRCTSTQHARACWQLTGSTHHEHARCVHCAAAERGWDYGCWQAAKHAGAHPHSIILSPLALLCIALLCISFGVPLQTYNHTQTRLYLLSTLALGRLAAMQMLVALFAARPTMETSRTWGNCCRLTCLLIATRANAWPQSCQSQSSAVPAQDQLPTAAGNTPSSLPGHPPFCQTRRTPDHPDHHHLAAPSPVPAAHTQCMTVTIFVVPAGTQRVTAVMWSACAFRHCRPLWCASGALDAHHGDMLLLTPTWGHAVAAERSQPVLRHVNPC